ncbi:MAG: hypothetical protein ACJAYI_000407, partial [Myxococcota bacterium]
MGIQAIVKQSVLSNFAGGGLGELAYGAKFARDLEARKQPEAQIESASALNAPAGVSDAGVDINSVRGQRILARKRQELPSESFGPSDRIHHFGEDALPPNRHRIYMGENR